MSKANQTGALYEAFQAVARDLPAGWGIDISLRHGECSIVLCDERCRQFDFGFSDAVDSDLSEALLAALKVACEVAG